MSTKTQMPPQDWMVSPQIRAVVAALTAEEQDLRFVGGCVRDALIGRPVRDVDMATPARPDVVMRLLKQAGLKAIPTGLQHGTVTAVAGHHPFEITTLRRDEETDGRRAKVVFTDSWEEDAARRDLTMNALSCTPEGVVYDYFGGIADLKAGRIRFVGDPVERIAEDNLRLLRFFRFMAYYGHGEIDQSALAAARSAAPLLVTLSGERVRSELLRLLDAPDPLPVVQLMLDNDILLQEVPELGGTDHLARLLSYHPSSDAILRLASWLERAKVQLGPLCRRLRLSNAEAGRLGLLIRGDEGLRAESEGHDLRRVLYRLDKAATEDLLWYEIAQREGPLDKARLSRQLKEIRAWERPVFPLRAQHLMEAGLAGHGPGLGKLLKAVELWWIAADFQPDLKACLKEAGARV